MVDAIGLVKSQDHSGAWRHLSQNAIPSTTDIPPLPGEQDQPLIHVLVVDDERDLAEEIVESLQAQGWQAETVSSGADALARINADLSINVMLTDMRMPNMDGITLAKAAYACRGDDNPLSIIVLTGHATVQSAAETVRLGAVDFLTKPVRLNDVKSALSRAYLNSLSRRKVWLDVRAKAAKSKEAADKIVALEAAVAQLNVRPPGTLDDDGRKAFMSVVSHELRTPLVPILGLSELIEDQHGTLPRKDIREFAREIRLGGERLTDAITRITEFTDLSAGRVKPQPRPLRTTKILDGVAAAVGTQLRERQQTLSIVDTAQCVIVSDGHILRRALVELATNASRFSPCKTEVFLSVAAVATGVAFVIADQGPGMTALEIDVAMRPFQQIDMSLSRPVEGLGLGLALVRKFAECLGGSLAIESTPGGGTRAILHVPSMSPSHGVSGS